MADNAGQPLAMATPQAGQYYDTFELENLFAELCTQIEGAGLGGLFLNAYKAFDGMALRQAYAQRDIEANIPRNRRAADWQSDDTLLVPELY